MQAGPDNKLVSKELEMGKEYQLIDPLLKIDGKLVFLNKGSVFQLCK